MTSVCRLKKQDGKKIPAVLLETFKTEFYDQHKDTKNSCYSGYCS